MDIKINNQSSIKIISDKIIYFDPFKIDKDYNDADIIFITHDHYDHFSIEDIKRVEKQDTVYVIPDCMYNLLGGENVITLYPNQMAKVEDLDVETIPSYNVGKMFHPIDKQYLGYIVTIEGKRVYVAGDCDVNEDNLKVKADIAIVPIGGHYTMDYKQAAEFINTISPSIAIPSHYGDIVGDKEDGNRFKELVDSNIEVKVIL